MLAAVILTGFTALFDVLPAGMEYGYGALLQYDDGTPAWYNYSGSVRGVWFNTLDFYPWPCSISVPQVEVWFYHSSAHPWDTYIAEIQVWTGDQNTGPLTMLESRAKTVFNYVPNTFSFDPPLEVPSDFWCLQNTEGYSTGGWPSLLSDCGVTSGPVHSYYWNPGMVPLKWGNRFCNYMFRISSPTSLDRVSWGGLKTVF